MLIGKDGGLSSLCHGCGFDHQQRVLKTFPGPGYLCSEDRVGQGVGGMGGGGSLTMAFTGIYIYSNFPD